MEVAFKTSFVKDFRKLPPDVKKQVKSICTEIFPAQNDMRNLIQYDIKPLQGFKDYYRIKIGNYRIGFKKEDKQIIFMRVKNRKDIYKSFP